MQDSNNSILTSKKQFLVLITILSLVIAATGYFYYKSQESSIRQQKQDELKTISDLKANHIIEWVNERNADVKVVVQSSFFRDGIYNWLQDTGNVHLKKEIIKQLQPIQKEEGYRNIFISLPNGHVLLSAIDGLQELDTFTIQKINEASIKKEIVFTDLYFSQMDNLIHYDIIVPITYGERNTIAVLLFRIDPNDYFYHLIQTVPTSIKTAETVLLRFENDSVLFLNELRYRKNTALKLKISLTRKESPAVQAALGRTGIIEGIDYRGVEVLANIRKIQGTNWIMLLKIDKSELYSNLNLEAGIISGFSILLIIICGFGFAYIYRTHQGNIVKELFIKEKELRQQQENFIERFSVSESALRESEERFHSLFENSTIGLYRTTPQGDILLANPTLIRMLGFDNFDELAQRNLEQKGYETDSPRSKFRNQIEKSDVIIGFDSKWTKKDGTSLDISESAITIRGANGNVLYYDGTVEDITVRKRAEKELISAKNRAEEMSRLKSNFLANMSHELRTPLIGINGLADFLRQDIENPELKEMAEIIFNSGNRLSETLNLILDLSKLESERMDFIYQQIELVSLAEEIISLFNKSAGIKGIYLKLLYSQPSIFLNTDERIARSIFNNLINNAIKYTFKGGVTVDISIKENFVEIRVIDTGIGISKEYHKIIFEEFRQVSEGYSRNFEGTGLGLHITKKLVEKFGGEISVESELGKGAAFIVKLPVIIAGEKTKEKTVIEKIPLKVLVEQKSVKPLALLVDDDPSVYMVLKRYTSGQFDLESTREGELAVKLCMQKHYDYIFMDINLRHGMDGLQAVQTIRKIKGYESIPIIATTAYAMVGDKEEFLAAGCSHYLSKPFDKQDILNLLEKIQSGR